MPAISNRIEIIKHHLNPIGNNCVTLWNCVQKRNIPPYEMRELQRGDFYKGYLQLLGQLTSGTELSYEQFQQVFDERERVGTITVVIEIGKIVACGSLVVERKFGRNGGVCGHIEDVVVDKECRGWGLGKIIVEELVWQAKKKHAYKVILDCTEENAEFYQRCGFNRKEIQMRLDV